MDLQIGVIGLGAIGRDHVKRLSQRITGCKVVAVSEVNEAVGKEVAEQYGARFYADGEELINSPSVQAVMVTAWDPAHAQYVMASIKAGKPVFCEKPLATEVSECEEIVRAEQELGRRVVQVGFMRRYDPGYQELKRAIQEGKIGQAMVVHACHRNMSHAATMTSEMSIKNSGAHEIDVLRWLLEDEYVSGQVVLPRQSRISAKEGLQDPQIMMLRTEKGICIDVEISQSSGYGYDIQCEVVGDLGTARLPDPLRLSQKRTAPALQPSVRTGRAALWRRTTSSFRIGWTVPVWARNPAGRRPGTAIWSASPPMYWDSAAKKAVPQRKSSCPKSPISTAELSCRL